MVAGEVVVAVERPEAAAVAVGEEAAVAVNDNPTLDLNGGEYWMRG